LNEIVVANSFKYVQITFLLLVCACFVKIAYCKFFEQLLSYEHGQYKKLKTHTYKEGNTYSWKEMCKTMCLGS
jgi:hypothetical protein